MSVRHVSSTSSSATQSSASGSGGGTGERGRRASIVEIAQRAGQAVKNSTIPKKPASQFISESSVWGRIVTTQLFETTALLLILSNAIWIGVDVNYNVDDSDIPEVFFQVGESVFVVAFSVEMGLRILAYRPRYAFFTDPKHRAWNIFDLTLVVFMIIETWILTLALPDDSEEFRFLSTLRLLRLLRISRIFRFVPELGIMVKSLIASFRSVSSTAVLALGIMYIFAIVLTQWAKGYDEDKCLAENEQGHCTVPVMKYFGTIPDSFLTLMQICVFDDTFEIVRPVFEEALWSGIMLIVYMLIVSFTILNMLIGIICDIVSETEKGEKEKILRLEVEEVFRYMDMENRGLIVRDDFQADDGVWNRLEDMGIDKAMVLNAFDILDRDGYGKLALVDFISMIFKCLNPPTSSDVLMINRRIDRLAELLGVGRTATAVLSKEQERLSKKYVNKEPAQEGTALFPMNSRMGSQMASSFGMNSGQPDASGGTSHSTGVANPIFERMGNLRTMLTACQRALEAKDGSYLEAAAMATRSDKMDGVATRPDQWASTRSGAGIQGTMSGDPTEFGTASAGNKELFPPQSESDRAAKRAALGPALRLLSSQLYALRAEHKAAGLNLGGEDEGTAGQITNVIKCLESTLSCLEPHA